jgi:hypothetical protein
MQSISSTNGSTAARDYVSQLRASRQNGSAAPTAPGKQQNQDPQVQAQITQLKTIEEKVKAHEAAHKAAGGAITGAISYSYTQGPDGKSYITGGEVPISISPGKTPQETINRMEQVIRTALAPSDPSPQDRAVAAQAAAQQQEAALKQNDPADAGETNESSATTDQTSPATFAARYLQNAYATAGRAENSTETAPRNKPETSGSVSFRA